MKKDNQNPKPTTERDPRAPDATPRDWRPVVAHLRMAIDRALANCEQIAERVGARVGEVQRTREAVYAWFEGDHVEVTARDLAHTLGVLLAALEIDLGLELPFREWVGLLYLLVDRAARYGRAADALITLFA